MARASLFPLLVVPALTACLDSPPEYQAAPQVPPVIQTADVVPSPTSIIYLSAPTLLFNIPFRADDEGESLLAYFVWDIQPKADLKLVEGIESIPADPRPFDEQTSRVVTHTLTWADRQPGCHFLTMRLSHLSNFKPGKYDLVDSAAAADVSWFVGLGAAGTTCGNSQSGSQ